jgi:hypothetical protein
MGIDIKREEIRRNDAPGCNSRPRHHRFVQCALF